MSDITAGVFQHLSGNTLCPEAKYAQRIAAELYPLVNTRVYPNSLPQHHPDGAAVMPACVVQTAGEDRQPRFVSTDGLVGCDLQIDSYAADSDTARAIATAVRRCMTDYSGTMGAVIVSNVLLQNEFDSGIEADPGLYRRTQLFTVWYRE